MRVSALSVRTPLLAAALAIAMIAGFAGPAEAAKKSVPYLALGDSLAYGWDPVTGAGPFSAPDWHFGYPETLAARSIFEVTNASCPGETSANFINTAAVNNGCDFVRANFGLKADWGTGSQLDFATNFLLANPDTGLVTIQLGANDLFVCQDSPGGCTNEKFGLVLQNLGINLAISIGTMRATGYAGPIVLVGYYALDYNDPFGVFISEVSASVLNGVAAGFPGVAVADGFSAFEQASRRAGGDPCAAGLLLPLPGPEGGCDIHTSPRGDRVMAQAVHRAVDIGAVASGK